MRKIAAAAFMVAGAAVWSAPVHAQGGYGTSVAASGNVLYVAEPLNVARPGTVYAYTRDAAGTWIESGKLTAPASRAGDLFARAVAASGNIVIVGYPAEGMGAGAAHAFERQGGSWMHIGRLGASDSEAGDSEGAAVAVLGPVAAVAAPGERVVYLFRRIGDQCRQEAKLSVA
jgi:hypothetical protein